MLDIDNDIKIRIRLNTQGKIKAFADLIIGDFIEINNFSITQAANGKLYVINPHVIKNIFNKVECQREINYVSTASLLSHKNRKKLVDRIIEEFGKKIDELKKATENQQIRNRTYNSNTYHKINVKEDE